MEILENEDEKPQTFSKDYSKEHLLFNLGKMSKNVINLIECVSFLEKFDQINEEVAISFTNLLASVGQITKNMNSGHVQDEKNGLNSSWFLNLMKILPSRWIQLIFQLSEDKNWSTLMKKHTQFFEKLNFKATGLKNLESNLTIYKDIPSLSSDPLLSLDYILDSCFSTYENLEDSGKVVKRVKFGKGAKTFSYKIGYPYAMRYDLEKYLKGSSSKYRLYSEIGKKEVLGSLWPDILEFSKELDDLRLARDSFMKSKVDGYLEEVVEYPFYGPFRLINAKSSTEQIPLKNGPFLICQMDEHSRTRGLAIFFLSTSLYITELYNPNPPNFSNDQIIQMHVLREIKIDEVKQCTFTLNKEKFIHWVYSEEQENLKILHDFEFSPEEGNSDFA